MENRKFIVECEIPERWVNEFCSFLNHLERNGKLGHSALVGFYADSDGDFRPRFNTSGYADRQDRQPWEPAGWLWDLPVHTGEIHRCHWCWRDSSWDDRIMSRQYPHRSDLPGTAQNDRLPRHDPMSPVFPASQPSAGSDGRDGASP